MHHKARQCTSTIRVSGEQRREGTRLQPLVQAQRRNRQVVAAAGRAVADALLLLRVPSAGSPVRGAAAVRLSAVGGPLVCALPRSLLLLLLRVPA